MVTQRYSDTNIGRFILGQNDTKPTDCPNGSVCLVIGNSVKCYCFDEEHTAWYAVPIEFWEW